MNWNLLTATLLILISLASIGIWARGGEQLRIKGSDTELQLVANFSEAYTDINPEVAITVEGGGSGTGIAALINGEIDIANSSRTIEESEIAEAEKKGINPKEFIIARDGLAVIIHPKNPIDELTIEQISDVFSGEINDWSRLGGENEKINLYGRRSTSGTYIYFRDHVLGKDYSSEMYNMPGSQSIVNAVQEDRQGIGYVGVGYVTNNGEPIEDLKILNIGEDNESKTYSPLDPANIEEGKYPIARPLYQYTDGIPRENTSIFEFLKFEIESEEARQIIVDTGFFPPMPEDMEQNREMFEKGEKN